MRKRILFNWYYHRADLTGYLLEMSDEFELIFIYKYERPSEPELLDWAGKNVSVIYWADFTSPYQLLKQVAPDVIVFNDIEAFNQIALNIAARNIKIPTYVLQHGVRGDYEVGAALAFGGKQPVNLSSTSFRSLQFLLRAFRLQNLPQIFSISKFIIERKRFELTVALTRNKAEWRNADFYIEFSKNNTGYHKRRDGIPEQRFLIIGNPQFDAYFSALNKSVPEQVTEPYALLIDTPFCEGVFLNKNKMPVNEKNEYLKNISSWCIAKGLQLFVKLHPLSYNADYLPGDENITYFKNAEISTLVKGSAMVFFVHFSTLAPLIMLYKPFIYLTTPYQPSVGFIIDKRIPVRNIRSFSATTDIEPYPPLSMEALNDQLYKTDGKATERLRTILRGAHSNHS